jgi:putative acetyltransferase
MDIKLHQGNLNDLKCVKKLFFDTITFICQKDYNIDQIKAWRSAVENIDRWESLIKNQYFIVAKYNEQIVGFASLDNGNYIDVLFVHKDFQRKGIAQKLYNELEQQAVLNNNLKITSDVSKTAKKFFERNGFFEVAVQIQVRKNVEIINFKMKKEIL